MKSSSGVMIKLLSLVVAGLLIFDSVKSSSAQNCWTPWFDRDDPRGTGDWETLSGLQHNYPGKLCPGPLEIEYRVCDSVHEAKDKIYRADVTTGFVCRLHDQPDRKCNDYEVRFKCHRSFCGDSAPAEATALSCWTKWYDRDKPSLTGDWENLENLRKENRGEICEEPQNIEVVTTDTLTPALNTGQLFFQYSKEKGFVCRNKDQKCHGSCRNYKVRFECPCAVGGLTMGRRPYHGSAPLNDE